MTEPTYEYVKGQGWVIRAYPNLFIVDIDLLGKKYRVTVALRIPKIGERGWWLGWLPHDYNEVVYFARNIEWCDNNSSSGFGWLCKIDLTYCENDPCFTILGHVEL